MEDTVEVLCCPGCNSRDASFAGEAPGIHLEIRGSVFHEPDYAVEVCENCGLYFKTRVLGAARLNDYYRLVDYGKWEIPGYFPTERLVHRLLDALPKNSRVLDFGCSSGRLLERFTSHFDCYGFEPNEEAAGVASRKGLRMLSPDEVFQLKEHFDFVLLVDVFEHLPQPTDTLKKIFATIAPAGRLLVSTGNADNKLCQRDPAKFWYFRTPEHLCMWSRAYAGYLARALPAELVFCEELSHYDTPFIASLLQRTKDFAYWSFRGSNQFLKSILNLIPFFRRARNWPLPPPATYGPDHVVAIFAKPGLKGISKEPKAD